MITYPSDICVRPFAPPLCLCSSWNTVQQVLYLQVN